MEQKRVSFKVAKAIKEAGYPQGLTDDVFILCKGYVYKVGACVERQSSFWEDEIADAPSYLDAWLWLWRKKKINVTPEYDQISDLFSSCGVSEREDPEEAIIAAIEYLVDNDLIM